MERRWKTLVLLVLVGLMMGLALGPVGEAQEELRIGFVAPMTGGFAQVGRDMSDGFTMYLEEIGNNMAGLKVKFILEDTAAVPATAVRKAQKLIRSDRVHMIIGGILATEGYALAPVAEGAKLPYISPVPAADDLTQRLNFKWFLRTGWTSSQPSHPMGQWACDQGYKKIITIGADYAFGHEVIGGFHRAFEDCGGKIIKKIWPPLGTIDFGPYLPLIPRDADAVFALMVGPMSLQFPKQYRAAGLTLPLLGGGTSADEFVLPFMGDEAIGYVTPLQYSAALQTEKNMAFVKKYRAKYGKVPSYYSESNYTTAQWIHEVIKKAGGKWPGGEKFFEIFKTVKLDTVRGPVYLDERANPVQNIYIRKVEKKKMLGYEKEELWNTVVKTYENVGQFWKYDKEKYLKEPLYSRDYPPCKNCQ